MTHKQRLAAATVKFPQRDRQGKTRGLGILAVGNVIVTAAHLINWTSTGGMTQGEDKKFIEPIVTADGRRLEVYPTTVELLADIAVLGAVDNEDEVNFEKFCEETAPVEIATTEYPLRTPIPAFVLSHKGVWIPAQVFQLQPKVQWLKLETDERIESGTSGGPVMTEDGFLLGVISHTHGKERGKKGSVGKISRPHLASPVWLAEKFKEKTDEQTDYPNLFTEAILKHKRKMEKVAEIKEMIAQLTLPQLKIFKKLKWAIETLYATGTEAEIATMERSLKMHGLASKLEATGIAFEAVTVDGVPRMLKIKGGKTSEKQ